MSIICQRALLFALLPLLKISGEIINEAATPSIFCTQSYEVLPLKTGHILICGHTDLLSTKDHCDQSFLPDSISTLS